MKDRVLYMTEADIQDIPTEAQARELLGECWEWETHLEHKHRLLNEQRERLWKRENAQLIKDVEANKLAEKLVRYLKQNQFIK